MCVLQRVTTERTSEMGLGSGGERRATSDRMQTVRSRVANEGRVRAFKAQTAGGLTEELRRKTLEEIIT